MIGHVQARSKADRDNCFCSLCLAFDLNLEDRWNCTIEWDLRRDDRRRREIDGKNEAPEEIGGRDVRMGAEKRRGKSFIESGEVDTFPWKRSMARNGVSSTVMQKMDEWEKKGGVWVDLGWICMLFSGKP
jgi:hypothetical protein